MKWRVFRLFGIVLVGMIVINFNSCGSDSNGWMQMTESEMSSQEIKEQIIGEMGMNEIETDGIEENRIERVSFLREYEEIMNIEEVDITHDGIKDKIVTSLYYGSENGEKISIDEKLKEGMCHVRVYDGTQILEDGLHSKKDCIWERDYGFLHVGNGQLYLLNWNGEDFLISNSDYMSGGCAAFEFTVFYLTNSGEVIEKEGKGIDFCLNINLAQQPGIPVDEAVEYTECLDGWLKDSELLVYFTVSSEPRVRTFDEEYSARADEIWDWISDITTEVTMENLYDVLTLYNEKNYGWLPEKTEIETDGAVLLNIEETTEILDEKKTEMIVNIEEADITHDGVLDKIVVKLHDSVIGLEEGKSPQELFRLSLCQVSIYDGNGLVWNGTDFEGNCIWEEIYASAHAGTGQLYLTKRDGMDYLITNTDYSVMGHGCYNYQIFYVTNEQEEIIETENQVHFTYDDQVLHNKEFPIDDMIAYTEDLEKELEDSVLLVYSGNNGEVRIRSFEESCSADAFDIWNWLKWRNNGNEFTMESLREMMEMYYEKEWKSDIKIE